MEQINIASIKSIYLNKSICGFCSSYLFMLGLYEFCDRYNINFSFNKNGVIHHYTQNNSDIWDHLFESKFLIKTNNSDRKYQCIINIPPSPLPFFNFLATTDENMSITKEWAVRLNNYVKYIEFKKDSYIKNYELSDELPKNYLGVHLRGTDSSNDGRIDPIQIKINKIKNVFETSDCSKIFLMTDDERYLTECLKYFGNNLIYVKNIIRSTNSLPLHEAYKKNYNDYSLKSVEHLQDLFFEIDLLSKCKKGLFGISAVTVVAKIINPNIDNDMFGDRIEQSIFWKNVKSENMNLNLIEC